MASRQPTKAEINALLAGTPTYDALVALGVASVSTENDAETVDSTGCVACRSCPKCTNCRNCFRCSNCSHCDDSSWLGGALASNGCHHCSKCHGSDPNAGGGRSVRLYYCSNLHDCVRCAFTSNVTGGTNLVYGVQVSLAQFQAVEALILEHIAAEAAQ